MSQSYPEDSIQFYVDPWWETTEDRQPRRGRLVWVFIPHVDQHPMALAVEGRDQPTVHDKALFRLEPLRAASPPRGSRLPVAALPEFPGEVRAVYRAKRRPALILTPGGPDLEPGLRTGSPKWQTNPTMLVAPFYGTERNRRRGGWNEELVARIRHCEYPQYLWDRLPLPGSSESILRLDQAQPIGRHGESFELTNFQLSEDALDVIEVWVSWLFSGRLMEDSILHEARSTFLST